MSRLTVEIPEHMRTQVDERIVQGEFADVSAYVQSLIASDLRRGEIDKLLIEAEDAYERGDYTVHRPGDFARMYEEIKRQRQQSANQ